MKKVLYTIASAILVLSGMTGCSSDVLNVESKTAPTSDYLYTSAEGLQKAVIALYAMDRSIISGDNDCMFVPIYMDYSTDLIIFRGGTTASLARLDSNNASTGYFRTYWQYNYKIIGKANEIIAAALKLGLDDEDVAQAYGEACVFRAKAYFLLYQRFERLYLNTEPTSVDNAFGRTFRAAGKTEIFTQIKSDLDNAIANLDWTPRNGVSGAPDYGRMTKAVAKHIRAQVAMWEDDWSTAITECEDIFGCPSYAMLGSTYEVFSGADLRNTEVLYAYQCSDQPGGGNSTSGGVVSGHRLSLNITPNYKKITGMVNSSDNGGYGWGRVYPNSYLLSLYDQAKDKRYTQMFKHKWYYNDASNLPSGKHLGDEVTFTAAQYLECAHPCTMKYFDMWTNTDNPDRTSSFKDVIVYRLAETALICAEAYYHRDGGASEGCVKYFNKTWERAGNDHKGSVTMDDIIDEYARELHMEGVRWPLLKRLGILGERVRLHSGDLKTEDTRLNANYVHARTNFNDSRDWRWPIPQTELDLMPGFGQNDGWL